MALVTRARLLAHQDSRLRTLVRHAYNKVPYYRRLYDQAGVRPGDIRGLSDLARIPIVSRLDLQAAPPLEAVAQGVNPEKLVIHRTSGYTGAPLSILRTPFEEYFLKALRLRVLFTLGLRPWHRRASIELPGSDPAPFYRRLKILRWEGIHCLQAEGAIIARLRSIKPHVVGGFAGSLARVAASLTSEDRLQIRPRFCTAGAETVSENIRRQIERGFNARVFNFYGSHEFNLLAYECRSTGLLHVNEPGIILEVLRDGRPAAEGEEGEVVGTALHSFAMPFIRFRLGDLVVRGPAPCPCGSPCATLASVAGRVIDRFPLPGGGSVHPYSFVLPLVRGVEWIKRYQIVQERLDFIRIRVAALSDPGHAEVDALRQRVSGVLPSGVEGKLELVGDIPPEPGGKYRPYYSLVRPA